MRRSSISVSFICCLTVRNHDRIFALYGLIGHGSGQINGQKHRVFLPPGRVEGCFQQHFIVSGIVDSTLLGIIAEVLSHPVLSKLLSASSSGYLHHPHQPHFMSSQAGRTNSLRMALTTALEKGEAL